MSVVYQQLITELQAETYLDGGFDHFFGLAVNAGDAQNVTEVADLIDLFQCSGEYSLFSPDEPIDVLHAPAHPFVHVRRAVGALHPDSFLGGITEYPPYDGTGIAEAAGVETPLMWIEPARLAAGAKLWRFHPGNRTPELRGVYHGIAWGWETLAKGTFQAEAPSQLIGPVVDRDWGIVPVEVEAQGPIPDAVTLVFPSEPPEEGFERLPSGLWAKRIEYHDGLDIYENELLGRVSEIPCRLVRLMRDEDSTLYAQAVAVFVDGLYAQGKGFHRYGPGVYLVNAPSEDITDEQTREVRTMSWDMADREAITLVPTQERSNDNPGMLTREIHSIVGMTAPHGWSEARIVMQIVGTRVNFTASAMVEGESVPSPDLPTALVQYMGRLKATHANLHRGAPLTLILECRPDGESIVNLGFEDEPPFADAITSHDWEEELTFFPRESIPDWAAQRFG